MKRRKVLAMLMTAVMTFTSVAPDTALVAFAEGDDAAESDVVVEELPFDLKGMPEGYTLNAEQLEMKAAMKENDVLDALAGMTEGVDYEAGTMFCLADSEEEAQTIAEAYNSELILYAQGVAEFKLPENITVAQALSVAQDPSYLMPVAEPNYLTSLDLPEDDYDDSLAPDFSDSIFAAAEAHASGWEKYVVGVGGAAPAIGNPDTYMKDPANPYFQWMHDMLGTYDAWGTTMGEATVKVAVLDTGVLPDHPDLGGRVTTIKVGDLNPADYSHSHGTHVAGIIAATAGNGIGVAGIAPKVSIISLNVFGAEETVKSANEVRALNICVEQKVQVANMSLGGFAYSAQVEDAMKKAAAANVNVFVAMGNENAECKAYPAACQEAIPVASLNPKGERSNYSNFGNWCAVAAPGTMIMSLCNPKAAGNNNLDVDSSGYYCMMSGTSMACPAAAGVAALYISKYGETSPAQMTKILQANGTKTPSAKIGNIVNAGNLFAAKGKKAKAVQNDDMLGFTFDTESIEAGDYIVYTTDGTEPTLVDGQVVIGQVYDGSVAFEAKENDTNVTVNSVVVTAYGEIGEVQSASFTVPGIGSIDSASKTPITLVDPSGRVDAKNKVQIYTVNVPSTAYDDSTLTLTAPASVTWTSSNKKVAEVVTAEGNSTVIKALKTGTAKITAKGADGSKASVTVKVIVPASGLNISPDSMVGSGTGGRIAIGKGKQVSVVIGSTYGKPSVTKLDWDFTVDNNDAKTKAVKDAKAVKISAKGKVTVNKAKWNKTIGEDEYLYVTAKTTDGTNLKATVRFVVQSQATILTTYDPEYDVYGKKSFKLSGSWVNDGDGGRINYFPIYVLSDAYIPSTTNDVIVSSSNTDFAGIAPAGMIVDNSKNPIMIPYKGKYCYVYEFDLLPGGKATGKTKVTIKLNDGSNKKLNITVTK